jgi:hypothetical protein
VGAADYGLFEFLPVGRLTFSHGRDTVSGSGEHPLIAGELFGWRKGS